MSNEKAKINIRKREVYNLVYSYDPEIYKLVNSISARLGIDVNVSFVSRCIEHLMASLIFEEERKNKK